MSEKRYFWLKLYDDFFTSKRIKRLRSIAGGDTYTIIYLKMQLKALKTEGFLYFDGLMSDFAEELALDLDEKPEDVKITLDYLKSVGLLEVKADDEYELTFMKNLIGSETASAQRVRDFRERSKENKALHCNNVVTEVKQVCSVEIEKEKEIEKDKDIISAKDSIDYQIIVDIYHYNCPSLPKVSKITDARKKLIKARLKDYSAKELEQAFKLAEESDFLTGRNGKWGGANFDWIMNTNNIVKILEGNYKNKELPKNDFNSVRHQGGYDFDKINRELGIK